MLFEVIGDDIFGNFKAKGLKKGLVHSIDETDNTGVQNPLSEAISNFNPLWDEDDMEEEYFAKAVEFAKGILDRELRLAKSCERAKKIVTEAIDGSKNEILVLPKFMPWKVAVIASKRKDIKLCVFPNNRGGYAIQTIPISFTNKEDRVSVPKEWRGKTKEELRVLSGENLNFCHSTGFFLATDTKDDALKVCKKILNQEKRAL